MSTAALRQSTTDDPDRRTSVEVLSPHAIVHAGIRALLVGVPGLYVVPAGEGPVRPAPGGEPMRHVLLLDSLCVRSEGADSLQRAVDRPSLRVIVLARREDPGLTDRALDLGADGCLPMHSTREGFLHAIWTGPADRVNPFPAARGTAIDALTARELEILALIAMGHSNVEMARRLFVSVNTIKSHIRAAYFRIGVHTRSQAVLWGIEHRVSDVARRRAATDHVRLSS